MEKQLKTWRGLAVTAICLLLVVSILYALGVGWKKSAAAAEPLAGNDPLSLWNEGTGAKNSLIDYVSAVTQEGGADYIPVEDRIAVFDMDGTLACETFYTYYDTMMFIEYCLYDHPERVSDELKAVAASIRPGYLADETLARNFAKAYAGMTVEEFYNYAVEFGQKKTASFDNMRYIDNFYLPMAELVKYLYDNGFEIWVISGTERTTTRAILANSPIRDYVEPEHVIGTDFEVKQRGHEDEPSNMDFKYENGDELVLTGGFIQKNLNGNKSIYVEREIGKRPVLAFGNSGSDTSMMNYAIDARNPYLAQAYMIVADDNEREWGTQDWEAKSADYLAKGFIPISMKTDFAQIYPDGITKAAEQYVPADIQLSAAQTPAQDALDYADADNWAYFGIGEDKDADLFLICPTVDMNDEFNMSMDDEDTKASFLGALNMERGICEESTRMYAPYYRQAAMKVYSLDREEWEPYMELAYSDVSAAFAWYLEHENEGRPIVLAGFSQGADMCYRLLEEYFGDEELYDQLVAVYAIGWPCTEELTAQYPQIRPAQGADDLGVVISFDCEAPEVTETFISPAGQRAFGINPLNWRTDETAADKSENLGACFTNYSGEIRSEQEALCGCYLDVERGAVKVTDIDPAEYAPIVPGLPYGAYHVYDYQFFFRNLQQNVAERLASYMARAATDLAA